MKNRFTILVLILMLLITLSGCGEIVGDIASNVAGAAVQELEAQIKEAVQTYSVDVVEIKSAVGKLNNDSESDLQFFCGVLVRSNSDKFPMSGAATLGKAFDEAGCHPWHKSEIDNDHLVNKKLTFKHSDFSTGDYYLIWFYTASFTEKLSEIELPTLPENWLPGKTAETEAGIG